MPGIQVCLAQSGIRHQYLKTCQNQYKPLILLYTEPRELAMVLLSYHCLLSGQLRVFRNSTLVPCLSALQGLSTRTMQGGGYGTSGQVS
jgi:hypothetical protein